MPCKKERFFERPYAGKSRKWYRRRNKWLFKSQHQWWASDGGHGKAALLSVDAMIELLNNPHFPVEEKHAL